MSPITVDSIQRLVAERYGIPASTMKEASRVWCWAHPRQVAMALARELTGRSLTNIGRRFGGRDHSTVAHAIRAVALRSNHDPLVSQIRTEIVERTGCSSGSEQTTRPTASNQGDFRC